MEQRAQASQEGTDRAAPPPAAEVDADADVGARRPSADDDTHERAPEAGAGEGQPPTLLRVGRYAWAVLGIAGVLILLGILAGRLTLLFVPLVIALFPAALLQPVARWLKEHRVPGAVAALIVILGTLLLFAGLFAALVPIVAAEIPDLVESATAGVADLEALLQDLPFGIQIGGFDELLQMAQEQFGEAGDLAGGAMDAATTVVEGVVGVLFALVVLFFYLKDDGRIAGGVRDVLPERAQRDAEEVGTRVWGTLGSYFRGQLLVALVDAVFIGLGLWLLGVPLALPLAVLVFFGGLFPIVGAVVSGALAVLVALADGGPLIALAVLGLVLAVQQLESNILEPLILSRAIHLHPLMVIVAITAGGVTLGILGAFLAVPVASSIARVVDYFRKERPQRLATA